MNEIKFPVRLFITVTVLLLVLTFTSHIGIVISKSITSRIDEGRKILNNVRETENPTFGEINEFVRMSLLSGSRG